MNEKDETKEIKTRTVDEWYEEMNRQFEEDSKTHDFSLSKEWDEDFRKAMFGDGRTKKCRKTRKAVAVAAGVAATVLVGIGVCQNEVIADGLKEIFSNRLQVGDSVVDYFGTNEEVSAGKNELDRVFNYKNKSLSEVYVQMKEVLKRPLFQIKDLSEQYEIVDAVYIANYDMIMLELLTMHGRIYVSQRDVIENMVIGSVNDENSIVVRNENLKQDIVINKSVKDGTYTFSVQKEYVVFHFNGCVSVEICKDIAQNLIYK